MTLRLDHIVIYVPDLARAMADYTELGFRVEPGGTHARTENALISFADGSYLELLALQKNWKRPLIKLAAKLGFIERSAAKKTDMYWRLLRWISRGTGIVDWCAGTDDIAATLEQWERAGLDHLGHQAFDRTRPDGQVAKWYLGSAKTMDLPFLIEDISARDIRVPATGIDAHPNGAIGISQISLAVDDPEKMRARFEALGLSQMDKTNIQMTAHTPGQSRLAISITHNGGKTYALDPEKSHRARIEMTAQI